MGKRELDAETLHAKYLRERDKRLRSDGSSQYQDLTGRYAEYARDPWAPEGVTRSPMRDSVDVVIVGGGFTGLMTAARLRQAGVRKVRIIEQGADFGGAWYWNRYPGIRCDIESYIYMPLLEETATVPSEKYARGDEIFQHARRIADVFRLRQDAVLHTQVISMSWDESKTQWVVLTDRDDEISAQFVVVGTGLLNRPKLPAIPGIDVFTGTSFHTSRWNFDYTGGDSAGGLVGLAGKRVAVIGTGATAIQCIPHIAEHALELLIFQRTPGSVDERNNSPTDIDWYNSQPPGWQRRRIENFSQILLGATGDPDLVHDSWTRFPRQFAKRAAEEGADAAALSQLMDYEKMEGIRARVVSIVRDGATAEALKPYYNQACKRPLFSDEYLNVFNRPNVRLINTDGSGADRIDATGLWFAGEHHSADCIIFSTGFRANAPAHEAGGFAVSGRHGRPFSSIWEREFRSLHGMWFRDFPNLCVVGGVTQAAVTSNFVHMLSEQSSHAAAVIAKAMESGAPYCEPTAEAEERWAQAMEANRIDISLFEAECTPSFLNNEGDTSRPTILNGWCGGGPFEYFQICRDWLDDGFEKDMQREG